MSDALAIAASGLKSEEYFIDRIANDLANLNTYNYKATKLSFDDVFYKTLNHSDKLNNVGQTQIGLGTAITHSSKDFSQGPLKPGKSWNEVAIDGPGFFQVINNEGEIIYARTSYLSIDNEHYLATQDGLRLADNIQIPDDFTEIKIQQNGDIEIILSDESEPQLLGTLKLARFLNPEALESLGSGLYQSTEQTSEAIVDSPGSSGIGQLLQNQIEGSNVDMVQSLMQLTMAQRVYQLNAKSVQIADEMERIINEIRD